MLTITVDLYGDIILMLPGELKAGLYGRSDP